MTDAHPTGRRARRAARWLLAAAALVVLAACTPTDNDTKVATAGLPDVGQALQARVWRLDPGDSTVAPANPGGITLRFDDDEHASGFSGCNTYSVRYELDGHIDPVYDLDGHTVVFTDPVFSERECEPDVMDAENLYRVALSMPRAVDVTDPDRLVLTIGGSRLSYVGDPPGTEVAKVLVPRSP